MTDDTPDPRTLQAPAPPAPPAPGAPAPAPAPPPSDLEEALEDYAAHHRARGNSELHAREAVKTARRFCADMGILRLADMTGRLAVRWLNQERERLIDRRPGQRSKPSVTVSTRTIQRRRMLLRHFSKWAWMEERIDTDALARLPAPKGAERRRVRRALTADELGRLLAVAPVYRRAIYLVAATTGLRRNELAQLKASDVDLEQGILRVRASTTKNKKAVNVYLRPEAVALLREVQALPEPRPRRIPKPTDEMEPYYAAQAIGWSTERLKRAVRRGEVPAVEPTSTQLGPGPRVMRVRRGDLAAVAPVVTREPAADPARYKGRVFRLMPSCQALYRDLRKAGLAKDTDEGTVDFHSLRVTFCSLLARSGCPLQLAQKLMRHSDPRLTSNVYTCLGDEDRRKAVEGLPALLGEVEVA